MDSPASVAAIMDRVGVWWAVAGGWAIDLWLGEQTRDHRDVQVVVRRCDQQLVHVALSANRELFVLDPPGGGWRLAARPQLASARRRLVAPTH